MPEVIRKLDFPCHTYSMPYREYFLVDDPASNETLVPLFFSMARTRAVRSPSISG